MAKPWGTAWFLVLENQQYLHPGGHGASGVCPKGTAASGDPVATGNCSGDSPSRALDRNYRNRGAAVGKATRPKDPREGRDGPGAAALRAPLPGPACGWGSEPGGRDGGHSMGCIQRAGGLAPPAAHSEPLSSAGVILKGHCNGDTSDLLSLQPILLAAMQESWVRIYWDPPLLDRGHRRAWEAETEQDQGNPHPLFPDHTALIWLGTTRPHA